MANPEHHDYDGITEDREQRPPAYFTVLFYGLIVWGVVFSAFYLLSGWSSDAEFQARMQAHQAQYQGQAAAPAVKPAPVVKPAEPAPPKAPEPATVAAAAPAAAAKTDIKALFEAKCTGCHGAGGKGGFGPDLTAPVDKYEYGKTRQALFMSIEEGRGNGKMPGFKGQLKREEIYALADYILALK
jgi:cytochrome c oxidase cbb3-type subunit 3